MISNFKYIKTFSQGQVTIPKEFRNTLGLDDSFWAKIWLDQNKIILEPVSNKPKNDDYLKKILSIKGNWFDERDWQKMRKQVNKRPVL